MKGILLDENIPQRTLIPTSLPLFHSTDLGSSASDTFLWKFAREGSLVILTKDADFSNRIMLSSPPPWIVHLRFGNLRRREFQTLLTNVWPQIEVLLPRHKLINVFADRIEGVQG